MKRKKTSRKTELALAVLWTFITALWAVTAFVRTFAGEGGIDGLTIVVLLVTAVASILRWYRYANWTE